MMSEVKMMIDGLRSWNEWPAIENGGQRERRTKNSSVRIPNEKRLDRGSVSYTTGVRKLTTHSSRVASKGGRNRNKR